MNRVDVPTKYHHFFNNTYIPAYKNHIQINTKIHNIIAGTIIGSILSGLTTVGIPLISMCTSLPKNNGHKKANTHTHVIAFQKLQKPIKKNARFKG
jgi:hypothetical protein